MKIYQTQINQMIGQLAEQVRASGLQFARVVGIERGGLHASIPLANMLGLPHKSVYISRYDGRHLRVEPVISGMHPIGGCPPPVTFGAVSTETWSLVVDDIVDTGKTIELYNRHCGPYFKIATLFWNPDSQMPDFYAEEKPDTWIEFPWESE